jgi:predicted  nucleic acid-binding Zn-ribbon protein
MAWFANHYTCARCSETWTDEWSCMCDDDCPHCGARHMSPHDDSEDLTGIIVREHNVFVVLWSPDSAEDSPAYEEVARFRSEKRAKACLDRLLHVET